MKKYCHNYPTCLHCLEPHITGSKVEFVGFYNNRKLYRCLNCNTFFYTEVNLEEFNIWNRINSEGYSEKKYSFPFLWDINLNEIENAYIDWIIDEKPTDKFLITWPTKEVNFIPILVFEYISNNPNSKVVIIDSFYKISGVDINSFSKPSYKERFSYLYYFEEDSFVNPQWDDEIYSDNILFRNKSFFLKKIKTFHYHLKISGDNHFDENIDNSVPACDFNNILDFKNQIKKKLLRDYGKNSINLIQLKELGGKWKSTQDKVSEEGFLSLKIDERYEWSQNRYFNQSPYLNLLLNINNIKSTNNILNIFEVTEELDKINHDNNLFIFNSDSEFNIFDEIYKINPSLIIFNNFDEFITRYKFYHDASVKDFSKFIKENRDLCMLFFSVNKDLRHLYGFNKENSFIKWNNLIPHTWDNINVLNSLDLTSNLNKPPFSSKISKFNKKKFNVKYVCSEEVTYIEKMFNINEMGLGNDFKKFFKYLLQSPLYIFPQDNEFTLFKLDDRSFLDWLNIIQLKNPNLAKEIYEAFENFYFYEDYPSNPLLDKLVETILKIYNKSKKVKIKVIVHYYAKKGVKKLLSDCLKNEDLENMIEVISWTDLNNEIFNHNELSYVIAFSYPFFNYFIYNSPFTNFIFIGGEKHIDKIKFIVENRIDINTNSPIYFSINDNAPPLLIDTLDSIKDKIEPDIDFNEYFNDYEFEFKDHTAANPQNNTISSIKLKTSTLAYLLIDNFGKGLFVPLNHSLTIKRSKYSIETIDLEDSNLDELKGKEIILNNDFYTSYKEMFANFVVENGKNTEFKSPFKKWVGFYQLFSDANLWLDATHSLVNSISKHDNISVDESKELITKLLIKKGIDVSKDRIINYWLSEPKKLETSEGVLGIYELERPRSYKHLEIIFEVLIEKNDYIPNFHFDSTSAKSSYEAILILQSIRRNFLKEENIQSKYQYLHNQLLKEIEKIIKLSSSFVISDVHKVSLTNDVSAYKIIENPNEYY